MRPLVLAALLSLAIAQTSLAADKPISERPLESVPVVGGVLTTGTEQFAQKAYDDSVAEVTLARLALKNSENAEVKEFANLMIKDHSAASEELKKIISAENIKLSEKPDDEAKDMAEKLASLKGKDFDRAYMDDMVDDHEDTVDLFQDYIKDGENAKLKEFATKTLPKLQGHLEKAKALDDKLERM
jgi:putative membrane protein